MFLFYYSNHILDKHILPLSFQDMQQIHDEKIKIHSLTLFVKLSEENIGKKILCLKLGKDFQNIIPIYNISLEFKKLCTSKDRDIRMKRQETDSEKIMYLLKLLCQEYINISQSPIIRK